MEKEVIMRGSSDYSTEKNDSAVAPLVSGLAALSVLGLFGRSKKVTAEDLDLMPPPPPFPSIDEELAEEEKPVKGPPKKHSLKKPRKKKASGKRKSPRKKTARPAKKKPGKKMVRQKKAGASKKRSLSSQGKNAPWAILGAESKPESTKKVKREKTKDQGQTFQTTLPDTIEVAGISHEIEAMEGLEFAAGLDMEGEEQFQAMDGQEGSWETEHSEREIEKAIDTIQHKVSSKRRQSRSKFAGLFMARPRGSRSLKTLAANSSAEEPTRQIIEMVEGARDQLMQLDIEGAKATYIEIMKVYNALSPEEQREVYQPIRDLYEERRNAESMHLK